MVVGYKSGFSMPSNHAANLAAVALLLGARYRRLIAPGVIAALVVGFTRVYVGVHYPLDVLAGYGVGLMTGLIGLALWEKVNRGAVERPVDNP
jgi:undecaprenyl-diphosphatase